MKITLCIPLYNEEKILRETCRTVKNDLDAAFGGDYEVLFVDDGSTDGSRAILDELCDERIRTISYAPNRGKGYAVRQGMLTGNGDLIFFTDCDLAYGTDVIREIAAQFDADPDLGAVIGSRAKHPEGYAGYPHFRKFVSKIYLSLLRIFGGLSLSDSQTGLKAFRREAAKKIFSLCEVDRFAFDYEALKIGELLGVKIGEFPVKIVNNRPSTVRFFRDTRRMIRDVAKTKKRLKRLKKQGKIK